MHEVERLTVEDLLELGKLSERISAWARPACRRR